MFLSVAGLESGGCDKSRRVGAASLERWPSIPVISGLSPRISLIFFPREHSNLSSSLTITWNPDSIFTVDLPTYLTFNISLSSTFITRVSMPLFTASPVE